MRLLWYGETPYISTGAGQVARRLLPVLQEFFSEIHLIAINHWWQEENLPDGLTITAGSQTDLWNQEHAKAAIESLDHDVLFLTTDINKISDLRDQIAQAHRRGIPIVMYAAMDCHVFARSFWQILEFATVPIVFTEWCRRHALLVLPELHNLRVIYHGCEPDIFYPLEDEERRHYRREFFGIGDETFLVLNVNRNQVRKDLARSMAAFHLFHREHSASMLYLHAKQRDLGGSLPNQAQLLGLRLTGTPAEIVFSPETYHEADGVSREDLNRIYNCADVCISTSTGEGWGLTTTEAMAAGVPFIGPDNTSFPEILGGRRPGSIRDFSPVERGYLVESGGPDLWTIFYGATDSPREVCSTTGMQHALAYVYAHREEARWRARFARDWTHRHSWQHIQEQWRAIWSQICDHQLPVDIIDSGAPVMA